MPSGCIYVSGVMTSARQAKFSISLVAFVFFVSSVELYAQANFYQGKTIKLIIGSSAGGGYDLWPRFVAPYFTRHIPGNPEIIPQNMPGAGGIVAANYVYNVAK